ncbi:MAG: lipid A deacylase LpxR family protein [Cellvibrionaceae bacterium]|nr:lipid A deacylase LpxR family protein [Cellvibrionaceae bacterium]
MKLPLWLRVISTAILLSASPLLQSASFTIQHDNDLLVPSSRDQDYTAGLSLRYSNNDREARLPFYSKLHDVASGFIAEGYSSDNHYSIEAGLYGFTPEQREGEGLNPSDRPFASLFYLSSSERWLDSNGRQSIDSRFTVGVLGLDLFADLQDGVHSLTGSRDLRGWDHQVSDGGELTARYELSQQSLLREALGKYDLSWGKSASLGYITEASLFVSGRYGSLVSPWWQHQAQLNSYGESAATSSAKGAESFWFWGAALKLRAYNAFLQGQFRDSEIKFSSSELNHALIEGWLGYSHSLNEHHKVSFMLRAHTSEVRNGVADRNVVWGGLVYSHSW